MFFGFTSQDWASHSIGVTFKIIFKKQSSFRNRIIIYRIKSLLILVVYGRTCWSRISSWYLTSFKVTPCNTCRFVWSELKDSCPNHYFNTSAMFEVTISKMLDWLYLERCFLQCRTPLQSLSSMNLELYLRTTSKTAEVGSRKCYLLSNRNFFVVRSVEYTYIVILSRD